MELTIQVLNVGACIMKYSSLLSSSRGISRAKLMFPSLAERVEPVAVPLLAALVQPNSDAAIETSPRSWLLKSPKSEYSM